MAKEAAKEAGKMCARRWKVPVKKFRNKVLFNMFKNPVCLTEGLFI